MSSHTNGERPWALFGVIGTIVLLGLVGIFLTPKGKPAPTRDLQPTIADLSPVHSGVFIGDKQAKQMTRLEDGQTIRTDADGRARLRIDTGASLVLDGGTSVVLNGSGFSVESGRVFLHGTQTPTKVQLGEFSFSVVGSAIAIEKSPKLRVYVADGEIVAQAAGQEITVRGGESAVLSGGKIAAVPERGFDDWTGGLAAPWGASGPPRRTIAELWARSGLEDAGSPLTVRSQAVHVDAWGEFAQTRVVSTFFNASDRQVLGDYRMAVPLSAHVSGFAVTRNKNKQTARLVLAARSTENQLKEQTSDALEWAGDGWVRGILPNIAPGQSIEVEVSYVEWLPVRQAEGGYVASYRFPLAGEAAAPIIGEFSMRVDARQAGASRISAGMGASADGAVVELRKADFKASADFVVDLFIPEQLPKARAYIAKSDHAAEEPTIFVRAEAPVLPGVEEGITLAFVLDTSASIDPALFAASRAFIEATLRSLGSKDRALVLAADGRPRSLGPELMGVVDDARRTAILDALAQATLGGATDLGAAFEAAADTLPDDAPSAMVVYVGDGFPSVGDRTAEAIRARLARRKAGVPRLGAVLVGPNTNRQALAALVAGSGPVLEVADSEDAARTAVALLERALVPTVTGVSLDLGPQVIRTYPRDEIAVPQGSSFAFVGRLTGEPSSTVTLRYRKGAEQQEEKLKVEERLAPLPQDLRRRWAAERGLSMALLGKGREAVTQAAVLAELLTPWTMWTTGSDKEAIGTGLDSRVLDLGMFGEPQLVSAINPRAPSLLSLSNEIDALRSAPIGTLEDGVAATAQRLIHGAFGQLRACRDARAALRPGLPGALEIRLKLEGDAQTAKAEIVGAGDDALGRCVQTVVENLPYPRVDEALTVQVRTSIVWPPGESLRGKKCSPASTLPLPQRRGVWSARLQSSDPATTFEQARQGCEIATWTAKRTLLEMAVARSTPLTVLNVADGIERLGDLEAAAFLRKEALRRATPESMVHVRHRLLAREVLPHATFKDRYGKATDDRARLKVVTTFLQLAPHHPLLLGRKIALLSALGEKETLLDEVRKLRGSALVDATLLGDAASALLAHGEQTEALRTFGEIAERASSDPWALAFLGDRLRNEQLFEPAASAYTALAELMPGDATAEVRLGLAEAGAKRLDLATRRFASVARTGGRGGVTELARLSEIVAQTLMRDALLANTGSEGERGLLERRAADLGFASDGRAFLLQFPAAQRAARFTVEHGPKEARSIVLPEAPALNMGLSGLTVPSGDRPPYVLSIRMDKPQLAPDTTQKARLVALVDGTVATLEFELPRNTNESRKVLWDGSKFADQGLEKDAATAGL